MNTTEASLATRFKVGIFTLLALVLIGAVTIYVNDKPFWWRSCQLVHINIEDATGLKGKSPVRSLGLQIGYLSTVDLTETHVRLGICITAEVEILPDTKAYIKGEGFLGDKFVELKPVRYTGELEGMPSPPKAAPNTKPSPNGSPSRPAAVVPIEGKGNDRSFLEKVWDAVVPGANAAPPKAPQSPPRDVSENPAVAPGRATTEVPVGTSQDMMQMMNKVDDLVKEMTELTQGLKQGLPPKELRSTMVQLNKTLDNTSRVLAPDGGLNSTAQRTLAKLEDAIEQLRDQMMRMNRGEGSVGSLLNDPKYADELISMLKNVNRLVGKAGDVQFIVDMGGQQLPAYDRSRSWFLLSIWPDPDRYYRLGLSVDPRGKSTVTTITTTAGGSTSTSQVEQVERSGLNLNVMFGKVFMRRVDLSVGVLYGDGAGSLALNFGPHDRENMIVLRSDVYTRLSGQTSLVDYRGTLIIKPLRTKPFGSLYAMGGLESIRKVNGDTAYFFGAGLTFSDDDIKLLFAFR